MKSGHNSGTAAAETPVNSGPARGTAVQISVAPVRLLDLRAAAAYIGLSYWTLRDMTLSGILPTVKIPCPRARDGRVIRRVLIDRQDLDRFIEANKESEPL